MSERIVTRSRTRSPPPEAAPLVPGDKIKYSRFNELPQFRVFSLCINLLPFYPGELAQCSRLDLLHIVCNALWLDRMCTLPSRSWALLTLLCVQRYALHPRLDSTIKFGPDDSSMHLTGPLWSEFGPYGLLRNDDGCVTGVRLRGRSHLVVSNIVIIFDKPKAKSLLIEDNFSIRDAMLVNRNPDDCWFEVVIV